MQPSSSPFASPVAKRYAIVVLVLGLVTFSTGHGLAGLCAILTGSLALLNRTTPSSSVTDSADLIAALATVTAGLAGASTFLVLSLAAMVMMTSPARFCTAATMLLERTSHMLSSNATASPLDYIEADSGRQLSALAPLAPMDTSSPPAVGTAAFSPAATATVLPHLGPLAEYIKDIACGESAGMALLALGAVTACYALFVTLPLTVASMRLARIARRAGGCSFCAPSGLLVHPHSIAGGRQNFDPSRDVVFATPLQPRGAFTSQMPDGSVAVAVAVAAPVRQGNGGSDAARASQRVARQLH